MEMGGGVSLQQGEFSGTLKGGVFGTPPKLPNSEVGDHLPVLYSLLCVSSCSERWDVLVYNYKD